MPLKQPVLTGPTAGRTVTSGSGSSAELKLTGDQDGGDWVRGDEARLLITLQPAGAEYFLVPRNDADADPDRFGIVLHEPAPAT